MSSHNDGSIELLTGKTPAKEDVTSTAQSDHPDFGMIASRLRGQPADGLPRYVGVPRVPFMVQPTYLGMAHAGFAAGDPSAANYRPKNLTLDAGIGGARLDDRRGLVAQLDRYRQAADLNGAVEATDQFRQQAFQLFTSTAVADAFNLDAEKPDDARSLWPAPVGTKLPAGAAPGRGRHERHHDRRPLAGPGNPIYFSWDDHSNPLTGWNLEGAMRWRAPFMDQGLSALIEDIYARGLDRKVMVVAVGEFGRTPRLSSPQGVLGRDHWPARASGAGLGRRAADGAGRRRDDEPRPNTRSSDRSRRKICWRRSIATWASTRAKRSTTSAAGPSPILPDGEPIRELI